MKCPVFYKESDYSNKVESLLIVAVEHLLGHVQ